MQFHCAILIILLWRKKHLGVGLPAGWDGINWSLSADDVLAVLIAALQSEKTGKTQERTTSLEINARILICK